MTEEQLKEFAGAPLSSVGFDKYIEHINKEMRPLGALPFEIYSHAEGRTHVAQQLLDRVQSDCTKAAQRWEESSGTKSNSPSVSNGQVDTHYILALTG